MDREAKFWSNIAQRYSQSKISDMETYEKKLEITRSYFHPDASILEIGCGTGSTALLHAPHVRQVRATDIAPGMIEIAREKAEAEGIKNISFEVATAEGVDVEDGSLDMVLALNLLHLVNDRDAVINRIHKMLKPGGVFISSTACLSGAWWLMRPLLAIGRMLGKVPIVKFFSRKAYLASLKAVGFTIEQDWQPEGVGKAYFVVAKKAG